MGWLLAGIKMKTKTNKKSLWREIFERGRGKKGESEVPFCHCQDSSVAPLAMPASTSQFLGTSSEQLLWDASSNEPFHPDLMLQRFQVSSPPGVFEALASLPIWPASYLCRRSIFQWSVPRLDPRPCILHPWGYLSSYDLFHRGLYTFKADKPYPALVF